MVSWRALPKILGWAGGRHPVSLPAMFYSLAGEAPDRMKNLLFLELLIKGKRGMLSGTANEKNQEQVLELSAWDVAIPAVSGTHFLSHQSVCLCKRTINQPRNRLAKADVLILVIPPMETHSSSMPGWGSISPIPCTDPYDHAIGAGKIIRNTIFRMIIDNEHEVIGERIAMHGMNGTFRLTLGHDLALADKTGRINSKSLQPAFSHSSIHSK